MKTLISIILFIGFCVQVEAQVKEPIHLSFNFENNYCIASKTIKESGKILFHIEDQFFKYSPQENNFMQLERKDIDNVKLVDLQHFLKRANGVRQNFIKEKSLKILSNDQIYEKIYLYEKIDKNLVNRYTVIWSSMIE